MPRRFRVAIRQLVVGLVTACLVILPMSVNALGFGSIRIKSALNEPLDAEIDLLSATEIDLNGLKVGLASREAFARVGIERPAHLASIRFSIQRRANGKAYLKLTTKQSVREPFLDFLLEMNWKSGRMLREYTVLLDPPGRMQYQPTIVESPKTVAPEVVAKQEQQETASPFVEAEKEVAPEPEPVAEPLAEESIAAIPDELLGPPDVAAEESVPVIEEEPVPLAETVPLDEPAAVTTEKEAPVAEIAPIAEPEPVIEPAVESAAPASIAAAEPGEEEVVATEEVFTDEKFPRIPLTEYQEEAQVEFAPEEEPEQEQATAEPEVESTQEEAPAFSETEMAAAQDEALEYGVVKKNDKLWKIAEQLKPDNSVSIYQVMMALLHSNPDAFIEKNVHRMKVGQILRIEDRAMLTAMTRKQAASEYQAQTESWEDYRQQRASASTTPVQAEMASDVGVSGESPVQAESPVVESSGELVLTAPEGEAQSSGTGTKAPEVNNEVVILREEIKQALAEAEAEGSKNITFNARLRNLENELKDLQRSLTVKDDELAVLQKQLSDVNKQAAEAELQQEAEKEQAIAAPVVEEQQAPVIEEVAEAEKIEEEAPAPVKEESKAVDSALEKLDETKESLEETGHFFKDNLALIILGIGGILAAVLASIFFMRRRKDGLSLEESILSSIPAEEALPSDELSLETNLSGESSFLSDFAVSGASALTGGDTDVDPLTEADVFMAYGRYEAAEERILDAIKKDPERLELRTKLLELYNTTKNTEAFEAGAEEFYNKIERDPNHSLWQKVVTMGSLLVPTNPLFAETSIEETDDVSATDQAVSLDNMGMETVALDAAESGAEGETFATDDDADIYGTTDTVINYGKSEEEGLPELNLDFTDQTKTEAEAASDLDFNLDFEVDDAAEIDIGSELDINLEQEAAADVLEEGEQDLSLGIDFSSELSQLEDIDNAVDFNIEVGGEDEIDATEAVALEETPSEPGPVEAVTDLSVEEELDSIMSDLKLDEKELSEEESEILDLNPDFLSDIEESIQLDVGDLSLDSTDLSAAELDLDVTDMDAELDATDVASLDTSLAMDEVGTKLDLAKAYIDMGDPDGARSILDEVLEEGSTPQQQEAQQLMQQI